MQAPSSTIDKSAAPWHALASHEVLRALDTSAEGLSTERAALRLREHGRNELPAAKQRSPLIRFASQFNNALIYFLLAAALLAAVLGHHVDASVILLVVIVNAIVGFVQEGRAEQALSALRAMLAPSARVLRDGRRQAVAVEALVPGDVVLLEAGDRVPADLRLLRARGLLIDEAILTGESVASEKQESPAAEAAMLADRHAMAWSGTLVAAGQGTGVVVATGALSEIGQIGSLIGSVEPLATPLLHQINTFGRRFTVFAMAAAAVLLFFAIVFRGYAWLDALMLVVALAVSLVPESLPAVITITLAIGVSRMAGRNAIVRRLPAVETLGATSIICSDKTGTLTRNEMSARRLITASGTNLVEGEGYAPWGRVTDVAGNPVQLSEPGLGLVLSALLCNDARLHASADALRVDGDPMEIALLALAARAGMDADALRAENPRLDEIPFDAQHRYMATLHRKPDGGTLLMVKGAPERVLSMCAQQLTAAGTAPLDAAYWHDAVNLAGSAGERVLGFAWRERDASLERLGFSDVQGLVFLGLVGFIDPPRTEAIKAVADCRSAGIAVKMITGDHAATAMAIAAQLGLADRPEVITGAQLDTLADSELPDAVHRAAVFARTSPEHKLRVVRALQSRGAVVAMTGDGVNDAPSLKQADVGIAMGHKGTEAAKEAAEVVLADDNFASIVAAVHEGRTVYDNIRKVIAWTIPTNGGEALAIVMALILGTTLPMTAAQILWVNLVLTITLGLVLAFEPPEPGIMERAPRRANAPLLTPFMLWRIGFVALLFVIGVIGMFMWALQRGLDVATARTMVVNTLCVLEISYLFSVRYLHGPSFSPQGLKGTPAVLAAVAAVIVAQLMFTYTPWMQRLFDTRAVPLLEGLAILGCGIVLFVILEFEKALLRRLGWFEELQVRRSPHDPPAAEPATLGGPTGPVP
ncbi:HAD-IC family P-type ATPase [Pusillimonas sp.]|uniref:HAD-IC family P-type ATPase n=1 Tax=Pusillimonas sp. TaxID=3040095 RepID=UPI0029A522B5|nr:HAD-IC family P-type ATPase [Pusillimonas sp.]MDX3893220.1 HAD-IC family P-type ATPase [Pusillimonas sp.]